MSYLVLLAILGGLWLAGLSFVCARLYLRHKQGFDPRVVGLSKSVGELSIAYADLHDLYERLLKSHKRLRSSAGMAKLRGQRDQEEREDLKNASEAEILSRLGKRSASQ